VSSIRELVEYSKKNPGKLNYGSAGIASTQHLTGEVLATHGVSMVNVPFKGLQPALTALLAGDIHVGIFDLAIVRSHVAEGRLKLLAITPAKRFSGAPHVPTVSEDLPGFEMPNFWMGYFGPARLPQPIVQRLNAEVNKALNAPEVRKKLAELQFNTVPMSPEELRAYVKHSVDAHEKVIRAAKIPKQ
jgi:tripartite-type tricarboxylate transporter receptor subunit TctC